ncbi:thioredoxin family protein [Tenacibaculum sp. UWU-22]|uniref:thioredoxin family protein n=1 Tax=Tenacibaculum sp. UWU-22 TaxID=3234187 RepID=UPI0034DADA89
MKKFILTTLFIFTLISIQAQEINWVTLDKALELQKKNPKKIIMDVYTNWCGPCKLLDKNTFHNKDVVAYVNENYYAVKFNAEGNSTIQYKDQSFGNPRYDANKANTRNSSHQFSSYMGIRAYPTIVFMNEQGDFIMPIPGYRTPQQLELFLKMFKNNDHKKMTSKEKFEEYYNAFKPTFVN